MNDPIQDTIRRTQRYWYVDGLAEIGAGSVILVLGLSYLGMSLLPPELARAPVANIGQVAFVFLFAALASRLINTLKGRLTFPRTGYVAYARQRGKRRVIRILITGGLALVLAVAITLIAAPGHLRTWLPLISGAIFSVAVAFTGYRIRLARFYILAVYVLLAGGVISCLGLNEALSNAAFTSLFGLGWIVSGAVTLWGYLRSTAPAEGAS